MGMSLALSSIRLDPLYNNIANLFGGAKFVAPLTHSVIPTSAASGTTGTFTRATTSTWQNNDGYLVTGVAGEIGFPGARRVDNLIRLGAAQSSTLAVAANVTMTLPAGAYQFSMGAGTGRATFSGTGGATGTLDAATTGRVHVAKTITAGTLIVTASIATLVDIQVVSMVAETDQTTIREYVSVGALDYRNDRDPLYLSLPGTAGHYASTPDAVANRFTGDQSIVQRVRLPDYTPASNQMLVSGYVGASGVARKFYLILLTTGVLRFSWESTTPVDVNSDSTIALSTVVPDGTEVVIGVSFDVDNGATQNEVKFWYSLNNESTWTQLGATVTTAGVAVRNTGTAAIQIGAFDGTSSNAIGSFLSLRLYNGIPPIFGGSGSATPVVDFNPHRDAVTPTGTITSSTTGEVWTLNGASSVVRSACYHGSMVDGVKCFGTGLAGVPLATMERYKPEAAATNLNTYSNDASGWGASGVSTTRAQVTGPDGASNSAIRLTETATTDFHYDSWPTIAKAASAIQYTFSFLAKKGTRDYVGALIGDAAGNFSQATFNLNTGVISAAAANTGTFTSSSAGILPFGNGWYLVWITATTNTGVNVRGYPTMSNDGTNLHTYLGDITKYVDVTGGQVETGSVPTSRIRTTTVAVQRNADVLTYTGGDIPNLKTLLCDFERASGVSSQGAQVTLFSSATNYATTYLDNASTLYFQGAVTSLQWQQTASNAYTPGTRSKVVWSMAANDIKMAKDGVAQTPDASASMPTVASLQVGYSNTGLYLNGNIGGIYGWTRNLSQSESNAVSTL